MQVEGTSAGAIARATPTPADASPRADAIAPAPPTRGGMRAGLRRWGRIIVALGVAAGIWLPLAHLFFKPGRGEIFGAGRGDVAEAGFSAGRGDVVGGGGIAPLARELAERHLRMWGDAEARAAELDQMRASNAEWDFMGRTFLVLALANMSLREPAMQDDALAIIDAILEETLRLEAEAGQLHFLMDYARGGEFADAEGRSLFIEGETALMLAARQTARREARWEGPLRERTARCVAQMERGPMLYGESYPNECWTFCNATALAALRLSDALTGEDHSEFAARWIANAREKASDPRSGLLYSAITWEGDVLHGPEGSSIWWAAHCLELWDAEFARDQYARARRELGRSVMGFGYAREWPASWPDPSADVDSGPIIPVIGASAGSSGLALVGAAGFGDRRYLGELLTTLNLAAFPTREGGALRYQASNQVGDAVLLYALVQGPLWGRATEKF